MVKEDREYRVLELRAKLPEEGEQEEYIVEGYATTFNDPYVLYDDGEYRFCEKIDKKALEGADMTDVLFLYNHEGRVFARQKNGTLQVSTDEHGIYVKADLSRTSEARKMYEDIKAGMIDQMSWAFTVAEDAYDRTTKTRTITKIRKVYDVSAVSIPANPNTEISARSYADGLIAAEKAERLEQARKRLALKLKLEA